MKKIISVVIIGLLMMLFNISCSKDDSINKNEEIFEIYFGEKRFDYDEAEIRRYNKGYVVDDSVFRLNAGKGINLQGMPDEVFFLNFDGVGLTGSVKIIKSMLWYVDDGDVIYDAFELDDTYNNKVYISSIDNKKKILKGNFDVRVKRDPLYGEDKPKIIVKGTFSKLFKEVDEFGQIVN